MSQMYSRSFFPERVLYKKKTSMLETRLAENKTAEAISAGFDRVSVDALNKARKNAKEMAPSTELMCCCWATIVPSS